MDIREDNGHRPWLRKSRAAAIGFGLGATLALSPLVWAENPAGKKSVWRYTRAIVLGTNGEGKAAKGLACRKDQCDPSGLRVYLTYIKRQLLERHFG